MTFVVMCAEKILKLLLLFIVTIFAWLSASQWPRSLWMGLRKIWQLDATDSLIAIPPRT